MSDNRRNFLKKSALFGLGSIATGLFGKGNLSSIEEVSQTALIDPSTFLLPRLPYAYDALEPFIDKETMIIHHKNHHQAYVDKLNSVANKTNTNFYLSDEAKCTFITSQTLPALRDNLGGHYNHSLFWTLLKANPKRETNNPVGKLAEAITRDFKFVDILRKEFSEKALSIFGSGWCWLILDENNKLKITTTSNQDNPLMKVVPVNGKPILALDVWEHAYYLKYQNRRPEYISQWWHLVNWERAEELFNQK